MTASFGPQLIGQTEKTLQALLRGVLADTGLDERLWVALRLADQGSAGGTAPATLRARVADLARFADADALVSTLEAQRLVVDDAPTQAGRAVPTTVLARSAALSGPIWDDVPDADAAARALTAVLARARAALDRVPPNEPAMA
jgi:hypothetical protein